MSHRVASCGNNLVVTWLSDDSQPVDGLSTWDALSFLGLEPDLELVLVNTLLSSDHWSAMLIRNNLTKDYRCRVKSLIEIDAHEVTGNL